MNKTIKGVGKDATTVTNENGTKLSEPTRGLILADPLALRLLGFVLTKGAIKHGRSDIGEGWYKTPTEVHLTHALDHILMWRAGDIKEHHLAHAQCRVHMELAVDLHRGPEAGR